MTAVDPTYPLYPVACFVSSAMLLLVLATSFIRQSWNLGVAFLCFWLFFENLAGGVNTIIWSDNADVKLYVYCDIVSHLSMITSVVKPMATLIIARRLYLITNLRAIDLPTRAARRRGLAIEWTLGFVVPLIAAGPLYYVVQWFRFEVDEGFGCLNAPDASVLSMLFTKLWNIIPPVVSIVFYYPQVVKTFYHHSRDIDQFLRSNNSVSRTNYFRILILASIDILLTLPIGTVTLILTIKGLLPSGPIPFYFGWTNDHTDWQPPSLLYAQLVSGGTLTVTIRYFSQWTSPFLAFVIFGLFGVTSEARASYWHIVCTVGGWFGWKPTPRAHRSRSPLADIEFGEQPAQNSMSLGLDSYPSFIDTSAHVSEGKQRSEPSVFKRCEIDAVRKAGSYEDAIEACQVSLSDARRKGDFFQDREDGRAGVIDA
ncbi:unnamed protein product [Peniophora sp. CBMAI 1063]|nr:unnamed protein product [Peniophora sp. CBMAI 1063]